MIDYSGGMSSNLRHFAVRKNREALKRHAQDDIHVAKKQKLLEDSTPTETKENAPLPHPRDLLNAARQRLAKKSVSTETVASKVSTKLRLRDEATQDSSQKTILKESLSEQSSIPTIPSALSSQKSSTVESLKPRTPRKCTPPSPTGIVTPRTVREATIPSTPKKPPPARYTFQTPRKQIPSIDSLPRPVNTVSPHSLRLPAAFQTLYEIFVALEQTAMFLKGQDQPCLFEKVKRSVENGSRRNFTTDHLGQIKTVYPEAYSLSTARCVEQGVSIWTTNIEVVFENELDNKPSSTLSSSSGLPTPGSPGSSPSFSQSVMSLSKLQERKRIFRERLERLVMDAHDQFLAGLGLPPTPPDSTLKQWHPAFKLDSVPSIGIAELPRPPTVSASNVLPPSPKKARPVAMRTPPSSPLKHKSPSSSSFPTLTGTMSLLERIRAKEQKKALETMYGASVTPESVARQRALCKLPDIVDVLHSMFMPGSRTITPAKSLTEVTLKIARSSKVPISEQEIVVAIRILAELVPTWVEIITLQPSQKEMIKLLKSKSGGMTLSQVKELINSEASKV